jgi:hypothetical protein
MNCGPYTLPKYPDDATLTDIEREDSRIQIELLDRLSDEWLHLRAAVDELTHMVN